MAKKAAPESRAIPATAPMTPPATAHVLDDDAWPVVPLPELMPPDGDDGGGWESLVTASVEPAEEAGPGFCARVS